MTDHTQRWRKSSYSGTNTECVEVAELPDGTILVRNSNHPEAGTLSLPRAAFSDWLEGCKAGELDDLT